MPVALTPFKSALSLQRYPSVSAAPELPSAIMSSERVVVLRGIQVEIPVNRVGSNLDERYARHVDGLLSHSPGAKRFAVNGV